MERSDHRPFAEVGFRSAQLLGRNEHGITPHYHLANDVEYDPDSVTDLLLTLETIVDTDWSNTDTNPSPNVCHAGNSSSFLGGWCGDC